MKKPALLRAAVTALYPEFARHPDELAMWVETGNVRATRNGPRGFAWEYLLTVVVEDFTKLPEDLFFTVVDWLCTQQPDITQPNAPGFPFEVDVINDKTFDGKMTLPLREVVTATGVGGGGWQIEVQPEPVLFPDKAELEPFLAAYLNRLGPGQRRRVARKVGEALRRENVKRIAANVQPDGSAMEPKKKRKRMMDGKGRVKRTGKMLPKIKLCRTKDGRTIRTKYP